MSEINIIVPIKQVPDIEKVKFDKEKGTIDRSSAEAEPNPFDLNALEEAVQFKEEIGATITVISMGPEKAEDTLRDAIARGADEVLLLTDKAFAGSDTWSTSYTLAKAIKKLNNFDLIICGEKTVDGDTGQVGPEIAEILDIPHVVFVNDVIGRKENNIIVRSETWGRTYEKEISFPALITVTKDVNEPRLPSLNNKLKAKNADIKRLGLEDLKDGDETDFGLKGSPTQVKNIEVPEEEGRRGKIFKGETSESVKKLIANLKADIGVE